MMGGIADSVAIYERLRAKKYVISIEDGVQFRLQFQEKHYHHLAGFQHIEDISRIQKPRRGTMRFYGELRRKKISEDEIYNSASYSNISDRITHFADLEVIMAPGEAKIIVDYDMNLANSSVEAKYYLFKRRGSVSSGDISYSILFIGYNRQEDSYYPATFLVERSTKFYEQQRMLDCTIAIE